MSGAETPTELSLVSGDTRLSEAVTAPGVAPRADSLEIDFGQTETSYSQPATSEERYRAGESIGRYMILETLGRGGMGVVLAAYDPELDRKLALKLLRSGGEGVPAGVEIRTRLLREAQAIARLNHPNVVAVHDVGLHEGQVFVAMEFVDGGTLGEWMRAGEEPRPWPEILAHFLLAGRGLAAAHAAGLVHRDFKPANVLLGSDGRPRVADFGIARSIEGGDTAELAVLPALTESTGSQLNELLLNSGTLTRTGVLIGTPAYMAPEQFGDAHVDARADQFAFCIALYEALYGERPFKAQTLHALIHEITTAELGEPPRASGVPKWLRKILHRGLAKDPSARWPDMDSLLTALERRPRRYHRLAASASLALAVLAGATAIARSGSPSEAPSCTGADAALAQTWSPATREALGARLASMPGLDQRSGPVLERLDGWALAWRQGWTEACEATHVRSEQSVELLDRRVACLQRQRRQMGATIELLQAAPPVDRAGGDSDTSILGVLDGLDDLVEGRSDPARCADIERLMAAAAVPEDPGQRRRVEALAAEYDRVYAALVSGRWGLAAVELAGLRERVASEGWLPLMAELRYLEGELHAGTSELEPAELAYREAFVDALRVGDEALAAQARRDLAGLVAEWDSRHDEAREHLRVAAALAEHLGDADLEASIALTEASTLELGGDFEAALAAVERGIGRLGSAPGAHAVRLADARYRESMTLYRLGRIDEARAALDAAKAGFGDDYGDTHPVSLSLLNASGVLGLGTGDWGAAEDAFTELLRRKQALFGPEHLDVSDALSNLGAAQYNGGKLEAARDSHAQALAIREREMGPDNLYVGHSLANLAVAHARLQAYDQAEQSARRAFAIIAAIRGPRHHDSMIARGLIAEVVQLGGDDAAALVEFREAASIAAELGSDLQRFEYGVQVALCLVHLGAFDHASDALDALAPLLGSEAVVSAQVLLYEYARARIAAEEGDEHRAGIHAERARARLADAPSSGIGIVVEAAAWLEARAQPPK